MKVWLRIGLVGLAAGLLPVGSARAGTSDVFQLQTVIHGVPQWDKNNDPGVPLIWPVEIRDVDLINLGLGRPLTTAVPNNEKLGLVTQCVSNDMRIIVYDTAAQSNLVTLGDLQAVSVVEGLRGHRLTRNVVAELTFRFAGTPTTGLTSSSLADLLGHLVTGSFIATGTAVSDTNSCLLHYSTQIAGALGTSFFFTNSIVTNIVDLTVTNTITNTYAVVSNFTVNVSSTTLTAGGKKLGTLIEP